LNSTTSQWGNSNILTPQVQSSELESFELTLTSPFQVTFFSKILGQYQCNCRWRWYWDCRQNFGIRRVSKPFELDKQKTQEETDKWEVKD
jgi:hypothetical protein